jgi:hypothetical protein
MKKILYVCLLVLFLFGCTQDEGPVPSSYLGADPAGAGVGEPKNNPVTATAAGSPNTKTTAKPPIKLTRNPFLNNEERTYYGDDTRDILTNLHASAIFYVPGNARAMINGRIVKEKDFLDNKMIIRIKEEEIILRDIKGKEYVVKLRKVKGK